MRLRLFSIIVLMLTAVSAWAKEFEIDYLRYTVMSEKDKTVSVRCGGRYYYYTTIPSQVEYEGIVYTVTEISDWAFSGCSDMISIVIPETVTKIGHSAFSVKSMQYISVDGGNKIYDSRDNCNAIIEKESNTLIAGCQNTIIPESVTSIGNFAFGNCSGLTSINIPDGVTSIENYAFYNCSSLTSINIPAGVTSIGDYAFSNCKFTMENFVNNSTCVSNDYWGAVIYEQETADGLIIDKNEVIFCRPNVTSITIPESVTSIGNRAFAGCSKLTSITIPDGVTSIGEDAFEDCSKLTSITIPESVTNIGGHAFDGCSMLSYNEYDNALYLGNAENPYLCLVRAKDTNITSCSINSNAKVICGGAFDGCHGLTSINIPENSMLTSIGEQAFDGCWNLTSINIPESVTSIGERAFYFCLGLTSITIPENSMLTSIGDYAFFVCSGLTSINIPDGVTSIGEQAFAGCSGLTSINIPDGVTSIGDDAFSGCSGLTSINIPDGVTSIGERAFYFCLGLTSITIPENSMLTSIGDYAFFVCSGLTSINIPDGVTSIGERAFASCSGLTSIVIDPNNKYYDSRDNCNAIIEKESNTLIAGCQNTTISESVTSIGNYAFEYCSGLTSINIPESVTSIGNYAFRNCSGLTSINIPSSVTSIGNGAFRDCSGLTSINIPSSVTSIGNGAFSGCSNINELHIGSIDSWCKTSMAGVNSNPLYVTSSKDVKIYVGDEEVTELIIPEGVTDIKDYAFRNCSGLTSVTIPEGVTSIGDGAFNGCSNLTSVIIPNTVTQIGYSVSPACYVKVMGENADPVAAKAEGEIFRITSPAGAAQDWDTRFYICLPHALEAGDEYAVTFEYKASSEIAINTWAEGEPGDYHHDMAVGTLNFTTEWQTLAFEGEVEDAQATGGQGDGYKTISFNLSKDKGNDITFEIRNISVIANGVSPAFSGCEKLDRLTCLATLPPEVGFDIFEESGLLSGGTVYIPEGTTASYREKWGTELNYVELTDLPQIKDGVGGKTEVVAKDYMQVTLYITIESGYVLGDIIVNGVVVYSANKVASDVTVIRNADGTYTLNGVSSDDVIEVTFNKSTPTAVEGINAEKSQKVIKTIEDGKVVIIRDGVKYDVAGRKM